MHGEQLNCQLIHSFAPIPVNPVYGAHACRVWLTCLSVGGNALGTVRMQVQRPLCRYIAHAWSSTRKFPQAAPGSQTLLTLITLAVSPAFHYLLSPEKEYARNQPSSASHPLELSLLLTFYPAIERPRWIPRAKKKKLRQHPSKSL